MAVRSVVKTVSESPATRPVEPVETPVLADEIAPFTDAREINARRAQIERPELLRHLRGL